MISQTLKNDDELGAVNAEYLGPDGYTFPFRARFVAYGIGTVLSVLAYYVTHRLGLPLNFFTIAWSATAVVLLTRKLGLLITFETPLGSTIVGFWHDVTAPRPADRTRHATIKPSQVKIKKIRRKDLCGVQITTALAAA